MSESDTLQNPLDLYIPYASAYVATAIRHDADIAEMAQKLPSDLVPQILNSRWAGTDEFPMYFRGAHFEYIAALDNPHNGCSVYGGVVRTMISSSNQDDIETIKDRLEAKGYNCEYTPADPNGEPEYRRAIVRAEKPIDLSGIQMKADIERTPIEKPSLGQIIPHTHVAACAHRIKQALRTMEADLEEATGLEMAESIHVSEPKIKNPALKKDITDAFVEAVGEYMGQSIEHYRQKAGVTMFSLYCDIDGQNQEIEKMFAPHFEAALKEGVDISIMGHGIFIQSKAGRAKIEGELKKMTDSLKAQGPARQAIPVQGPKQENAR